MPQIVNAKLGPASPSLRRFNAVDRPDDVLPHIGVGIIKHSLEIRQRIGMRDFAQRSRGAESCLLALPSEQWSAQAKSVCPAANPTLLRSGAVEGLRWRLTKWTPPMPSAQMPSAQLRLALPDLEMEASVPLRFSAEGVLRFERVLS